MTKLILLLICSTLVIGSMAAAQTPAAETTDAAAVQRPHVMFTTNLGEIVVELDSDRVALTVDNVLEYVDSGFYDGTVFHRVIDGFMIQGGGFTFEDGQLEKKETGPGIVNEAKNGGSNLKGSLAMARTNNPHSATAQFFINTVDNQRLDYPAPDGYGYTVFGRVISGLEVVEQISKVPTRRHGPFGDVPAEAITILSARRVEAEAAVAAPSDEAAPTEETTTE